MNQDVLFCPAGICCLSCIFAGLYLWWQAYLKWPFISAMGQSVAAGAFLALLFVVPGTANAQDMSRDEAKTEAEDLAAGLEGQVKDGASQTVNATTVPSFVTDDPSETDYYANEHNLNTAGHTASLTNDAAEMVNNSMTSRPVISQTELDEWTSNGLSIEADAQSIVTEYGGTYGDCTTGVSSGTGDTTYSYSCDEGETLLQFNDTCSIPLNITFEEDYAYQCTIRWLSGDLSYSPDTTCNELFTNPTCSNWTYVSGSLCIGYNYWNCPYGGSDLVLETTCTDEVPTLTPVRTIKGDPVATWDRTACDLKDADPYCTFLSDTCVEPAATRVIDGVSITRDCWRTERSYECAALGASTNDCDPPAGCVLVNSECLSADEDTGECRTTEHTYECTVAGTPGGAVGYCDEDVYCIDGDCETVTRPQNTEFNQAVSALSVLGQLQNDVNDATLEIFPGETLKCSKAVAGLKNCCTDDGILLSLGFSCSPEEESLALRKADGQCHYVGTYCSKKTFFGICLTKRRSHCCFTNNLARITHEQGRPQIGFSWGNRKNPDCSGFTVAQFQALDLSMVDFSEFYDEVLESFTGPDTDAATAAIADRIINAYQCPPNC